MKLTKAQRRSLAYIRSRVDAGSTAHADMTPGNRSVFERLERAGLIISDKPFAGFYHSMRITPAGRQALATSKGGET